MQFRTLSSCGGQFALIFPSCAESALMVLGPMSATSGIATKLQEGQVILGIVFKCHCAAQEFERVVLQGPQRHLGP